MRKFEFVTSRQLQPDDIGWRVTPAGTFFSQFAQAFAFTLAIEVPLLYLVMRNRAKFTSILITGVMANLLTVPVVWLILPLWFAGPVYIWISETFAVCVEFLVIKLALRVDSRIAFFASLLMNLSSFLFGLLMFR